MPLTNLISVIVVGHRFQVHLFFLTISWIVNCSVSVSGIHKGYMYMQRQNELLSMYLCEKQYNYNKINAIKTAARSGDSRSALAAY